MNPRKKKNNSLKFSMSRRSEQSDPNRNCYFQPQMREGPCGISPVTKVEKK